MFNTRELMRDVPFFAAVVSYAIGTSAAVAVSIAFSFEAIAFGLVISPFILPAIVAFLFILSRRDSRRRARVCYWLFASPMPVLLAGVASFPSESARSEGGDQLAWLLLVALLAASLAAWGVLEWSAKFDSQTRDQQR